MAGKSPTELVRDLQLELTKCLGHLDALKEEVRKAGLSELREWLAKIEERLAAVDFNTILTLLATLQEQVRELKKQFEEKDRRWWQFWVGVGLVGFTFVANLVIQLILLFSRKPA